MGNHNPTKRRRTADLYPAWVKELTKLQDEYCAAVKGKTFHSSWDDFLFCRLMTVERQQQALNSMHNALKEAKEFIENQQLPDVEWSRVLDIVVAALAKAEEKKELEGVV